MGVERGRHHLASADDAQTRHRGTRGGGEQAAEGGEAESRCARDHGGTY